MKYSPFRTIITTYVLTGLLCIISLASLGALYIEKRLTDHYANNIYHIASYIADQNDFSEMTPSARQMTLEHYFEYNEIKEQHHIWIFDDAGNILVRDSAYPDDITAGQILSLEKNISQHPPYTVSSFFKKLKSRHIIIAVHSGFESGSNLILLVFPMDPVFRDRTVFHEILFVALFVMLLISLIPLVIYRTSVFKPIMDLVNGVEAFSQGNLEYKIPQNSRTVLGYLSRSLNFMADRLNKNGQYQREVISNISHDFKSPLTSIKGYVEAMLDGTIPPEMHEKYLRIIDNEANRLEKLTGDLCTLSNLDMHKRELSIDSFDINQILRSCGETFEGSLAIRQIVLKFNFESQEQPVLADKQQIQQVIYNLLDNAIKFSPPLSTITIMTYCKNDKVFVSIKDQGYGIKTESLSRIFDRFYKEDVSRGKDRRGTGLGLSIVREIINAHGENINVISTEGVGSEFVFTLKAHRPDR